METSDYNGRRKEKLKLNKEGLVSPHSVIIRAPHCANMIYQTFGQTFARRSSWQGPSAGRTEENKFEFQILVSFLPLKSRHGC